MISKKKLIVVLTLFLLFIISLLSWYFYFSLDARLNRMAPEYYSGDLDGVIAKLENTVKYNTSSVDAYILLASVYAEKGSVSFKENEYALKAIATAQKALELDPRNAEAYRIIGYSYEISQNYSEAEKNYKKAIELDPSLSEAYSNLGHSYDLQGDLVKAEELYVKAISVDENNFHALLNLARVEIRNNKPDDAEKHLLVLIKNNPDNRMNAEAYQMLSFVENSSRNNPVKSKEYIEKSLSYDQNVPQVWVNIGMTTLGELAFIQDKEEWDKGVLKVEDCVQKALAINKNQASAYMLAALLASYVGDYKKAEEMRLKGLDAVGLDITLGEQEKSTMSSMLGSINNLWKDKK